MHLYLKRRVDRDQLMTFSQAEHVYEAVEGWGRHFYSPFVEVSGVGVDSKNRVYAFIRGVDPLLVFDSDGHFLRSWGRERFVRPHGLYVGPDDSIYCTDDGDHTVKKFAPDGTLLMTLGSRNQPSETGCVNKDYRTIKKAAGPFNSPTDVALDREGNLYVSDGYGNARIHKFSGDGQLLHSWGEPGSSTLRAALSTNGTATGRQTWSSTKATSTSPNWGS